MKDTSKAAAILRECQTPKRLIINPIVKRFGVKKGIYTEGVVYV
jgi:hypothetical protein